MNNIKFSKVLLVLLLTIFNFNSVSAQRIDYATKVVDGRTYYCVYPSLNNLITLIDCSELQFIKYLKPYDYRETLEGKTPEAISYSNSSLDYYAYALIPNHWTYYLFEKKLVFGVGHQYLYPENCLRDLYKELQPYYIGKQNNFAKFQFTYNSRIYSIEFI